MTKFLNGRMNQREEEGRRRRQQQQREAAARMELIDPPRYESVAHQVSATGGIQINHTENGTQVITESQHVYAESVPESSVTEDFEENDAATEDAGWEPEDTDDAISDRKKNSSSRSNSEFITPRSKASGGVQNYHFGTGPMINGGVFTENIHFSSQGVQVYNDKSQEQKKQNQQGHKKASDGSVGPSNVVKPPRFETSAGIQINQTGNGAQFHTFSNSHKLYQFQNAVFHGDVSFRDLRISDSQEQEQQQHGKTRDGKGEKIDKYANLKASTSSEATGSAFCPSSATENIHVRDVNTGSDIRISGSEIHIKEEDGSEVHVKNGTGNKVVHGSSPGVMVYSTGSNYRGKGHDSSYRIYNTGGGSQINGNVYGDIY